MIGSVLFHVGVLIIFFGHLFGLLVPLPIYEWLGISHETKQVMAMTVGGIAGVMALIGGLILLHRRLTDPRIKAISSFGDNFVLVVLVIQLLLGLATIIVSLGHLSGEEMVKLMRWAQSIVYFQADPAAHLVGVNILFKLHILLGLVIFIAVPFTRLVHVFSVPLRFVWRPGYQIVRSKRGAKAARSGLEPMAKRQ